MTRKCADCGTTRPASPKSLPEGKYRCQPCRRLSPSRAPSSGPRTWLCEVCGTKVTRTKGPVGKYCTEHKSQSQKLYRQRPVQRQCKHCGTTFLGLPEQSSHCPDCTIVGVWRRWQRANPAAVRAARRSTSDHRKRARHYGVEYEPVNARRVFARDNWRCGLCGHQVDEHATWPDLMCPSLDHVIPMSKGGAHSYANTQLAHWLCNVTKGNRGGGEQLARVG